MEFSKNDTTGDHVVGYGSAVLDINGGGDMKQYFESCYKLIDLNPSVLIPAHGQKK